MKYLLGAMLLASLLANAWLGTHVLGDSGAAADQTDSLARRNEQLKTLRTLFLTMNAHASRDQLAAAAGTQGIAVKQDTDGLWLGEIFIRFKGDQIEKIDFY